MIDGRTDSRRDLTRLALILLIGAGLFCGGAEEGRTEPLSNEADAALDKGWPRLYTVEGNEITLHQPQIDEWRDYGTLFARIAVVVKLKGSEESVAGIVELQSMTVTDHDARLVTMYRPEIVSMHFPSAPPEMEPALEAAVRSVPPARDRAEIALDRVLAYVEMGEVKEEGIRVNLDPPPIFYSDRAAVLVSFLGPPRFSPIEGTALEFGLNTNWDVIRDPATGRIYLLYRDSWIVTDDLLAGNWVAAEQLPGDMKKLPEDEAWERVRVNVPGQPLAFVPRVFVSDRPGEVIITDGRPTFTPIPGTALASIANSENTLFYHGGDAQFYFLAAGRWFRASELTGPWSAATRSLPSDFALIPEDDPNADILASVPGTEQARDAVFLASIPTTGVVNRSEAKAEVSYDGDPQFEPIEETTVQYAVNTPNDVFLVGGVYYVCFQAVWFQGPTANGPWMVADTIPREIYAIPPTSPKHHVTYVTVYDSTPTTVTCGHTSGYNGEVVSAGVVMFGLGMAILVADSHHYHYGYYPPYYWGYGPRPMPYYGHYHYYASPHGYGWSAHGPYGGAGYGARYNPATGAYSRGGYAYGPGGGAGYRTGYNPSTGAWAGQRGGYNAYGSWKQGAVVKGDDWVRGGSYSDSNGTRGGFQTSEGAAGIGYKGDQGSGYVVKDKQGNLYAGKDGNVYKREDDGAWTNANRDSKAAAATQATRPASDNRAAPDKRPTPTAGQASRPATDNRAAADNRATPSPGASPPTAGSRPTPSTNARPTNNAPSQLDRDYRARQTGNQRTSQRAGGAASRGGRGRR